MKFLRLNNWGEYTSSKFKKYLASEGIGHQLTMLKRLNKIAERMNWTLIECAHSIRLQSDMSEDFLAEVVSHASYLMKGHHLLSLIFKS